MRNDVMVWSKCSWFGIGIGIAVNDSQQLNGLSSDPIRYDSSQSTLSSWSSGIYKNQNWMCNETNLQWLIV